MGRVSTRAQSEPCMASLHRLNSVTNCLWNNNLLRIGPIRFPATLRSDRAQDQSVWGLRASTWSRVALRTRPQILGGMVSWKFRLGDETPEDPAGGQCQG